MSIQKDLAGSVYSGFIDEESLSLEEYRPKLLVNDYVSGQKVLTNIMKELNNCDEFFFSVAFITQSGVTVLLNTLKELEERNIRGKVVASQYLNFTNPKALEKLLQFKNIELRMVVDGNLHAKGYIFKKQEHYTFIVGSSNLTQEALTSNKEWNIKVSSMEKGSLIKETLREFERTFESADRVTPKWIETYQEIYQANRLPFQQKQEAPRPYVAVDFDTKSMVAETQGSYITKVDALSRVMPNKMQVSALSGIERVRSQGENKALLISATGTGKTYLAAFDIRKYQPGRCLFIVHRERILDQSIESFKKVMGSFIDVGKLCGGHKETGAKYLFSTVQTISKDDILMSFSPEEFDYIVVDETHRAGAESYQKILRHFRPKFLLGMTATPERTDEYNIYKDYDYNIAYEIRLQQAMEEDMLSPFHYFGVAELSVDGKLLEDNTEFKYLISQERVRHIIEKIGFYGYYGERVKGLIFCSTNAEAEELSGQFNAKGFRTVALSGKDSQEKRDEAIDRLEQDEQENALDYIFSVDIFNEGIDIPTINQIVMLRPTQSAIIFVQQLGRGLRKHPRKEYVVVVDFIGNYKNNFLIPMALSGDRSFNKDTVRRYVLEGTRVIPGCSTIHFEAISRKKIFEAIDNANFNDIKLIKESYENLKYQLGRIPTLKDFEEYGAIDVIRIFDNGTLGSYHKFLKKYEKEYKLSFSEEQEEILEFVSKKLASGKRVHELLLLKKMMVAKDDLISVMEETLMAEYGIEAKEKTVVSVVNVLTANFTTGSAKGTYANCVFLDKTEGKSEYKISAKYEKMLQDEAFRKTLEDLLDFGLERNQKYYGKPYNGTSFHLYQKYTYEDVCRLLEWEKAEVALNIGGYKFDKKTKTYPVFINYEKSEDINDTINYEDKFLSPSELIAISKSNRTPESEDVVQAYQAEENGVEMTLFVRKNKDDKISKEFYFLGKIRAVGSPKPFKMKNTDTNAVEIQYRLDVPVKEELYDYITS